MATASIRTAFPSGHGSYLDPLDAVPQFRLHVEQDASVEVKIENHGDALLGLALCPSSYRLRHWDEFDTRNGTFDGASAWSSRLGLKANVDYVLCIAAHAPGGTSAPTELTVSITSSARLASAFELLPATTARDVAMAAGAVAAAIEAARRQRALAAMHASAERGSLASRASWDDFCAASAEVERLRAIVRASGPASRYVDPWCSSPEAAGLAPMVEDVSSLEWVRPAALACCPAFVVGGFSISDVQQGEIGVWPDVREGVRCGDPYASSAAPPTNFTPPPPSPGNCYLMGAIASICHRAPDRLSPLDALMVSATPNPEGVVLVRFFEGNRWSWVVTDDRILVGRGVHRLEAQSGLFSGAPDPSRGKWAMPFGVHSSEPGELWPCLLEKAWAKLHGGYAVVNGAADGMQRALLALLPFSGSSISRPLTSTSCTDALWGDLLLWSRRGWPMELGSRNRAPGARVKLDAEGIAGGHAYSLLRVAEAPGGIRLLQLRNPWGQGEWLGSYADTDLKHWTPALRKALDYDPVASGDDGVFWLSLQDLCRKFVQLSVVRELRLRGDGGTWHRVTARGSWRAEQSMGTLQASTYAVF